MGLRITSWNVNGIRNPFSYPPWNQSRTLQVMFDILEADIVVMQETKIQRKDLRDDMVLVSGWDVHFSLPKHKKGYSGVAIYTRNATCCPIRAEEGITGILTPPSSATKFRDLPPEQQIGGYLKPGQLSCVVDEAELDSEGRCVILEFPAFVLFGVYSPASRDESRSDFRIGFLEALDARIRNLVAAGKQVVLTGDLNVIRDEIDTANLAERLQKEGMTVRDFFSTPSRRLFNQLIYGGRVFGERDDGREEPVLWDLCRCHHPARLGMFTCWDVKKNTRPANNGSRIDYVLCSNGIKDWFSDANIQEGLMGSDHCPVFAVLSDTVSAGGCEKHILDLMNPVGMFKDGQRLREWGAKDLLPSSAKLIPEFDRRRSIKDMFMKNSGPKPASQSTVSSTTSNISLSKSAAGETNLSGNAESQDSAVPSATETIPPSSTAVTEKQVLEPPKRPASSPKASRTQKKTKVAQSAGAGQSTLKSFFQPKAASTSTTESPIKGKQAPPSDKPESALGGESKDCPSNDEVIAATEAGSTPSDVDAARVFDPIENKESWSKLLGKRVPPRCEHDEPCISLTTKKPGVNNGRSFYICPRPLGPSGEKEKGTQWRCATFIWSSDWNGRSGSSS